MRGKLASARVLLFSQPPRRSLALWRPCSGSGCGRPLRRRLWSPPSSLLLATRRSEPISARSPAISERRCTTTAGSGLLSVPAPEQNQGVGLSRRRDGRPDTAVGLAGSYEQGSREFQGESRFCWLMSGARGDPAARAGLVARVINGP